MNPAYAIPGSVSCVLNPGEPRHTSPAVLQRAPTGRPADRVTTFQGKTRRRLPGREVGKDPCAPEQGRGSDLLFTRGPRIYMANRCIRCRPMSYALTWPGLAAVTPEQVTGVGGDGVEAMVLKTPFCTCPTFGCK
jgi:hypothetical protein